MDELYVGTKVVAHFFDVSVRAIQQWANAGMPKVRHGIYDLKSCHEWWLNNIADVRVKGADDSMNEIKIEYWRAKGEAERIRVDLLQDTLIQTKDVEAEIARFLIPVFAAVDQLPNRLPPIIQGKAVGAVRKIINDEICEIREALTKPGRYWPAGPIEKGGNGCKKTKSKKKDGQTALLGTETKRKRGRPIKSATKNITANGATRKKRNAKSVYSKSKRSLKKSTAKSTPLTRPWPN